MFCEERKKMSENPHGIYKSVEYRLYGSNLDGAILQMPVTLSKKELHIAQQICSTFKTLHPGNDQEYCFYLSNESFAFERGSCHICQLYARKYLMVNNQKRHLCEYCFLDYNISCSIEKILQIVDAIYHYWENGFSCGSETENKTEI